MVSAPLMLLKHRTPGLNVHDATSMRLHASSVGSPMLLQMGGARIRRRCLRRCIEGTIFLLLGAAVGAGGRQHAAAVRSYPCLLQHGLRSSLSH